MTENKLSIMCIKTNKGCFISDCFATSGYDYDYHRTKLKDLLFDGKKVEETYHPRWYYIEQYPASIQKEMVGKVVNERYELKDESLASDKMPRIIPREDEDEYNEDVIESLYSYEYDREPNYLADIPCDIQVVCDIDNYNFPPKINYDAIHKESFSDRKYTITNADVQHQMLDKIIFPEVLLHEKPCKFTSKQMYDITRQYILEHIDNSVANITSNYDFCFTVVKLIPLIEPETIHYQNIFASTKRERNKIHTSIKKFEEKEIFEMTHDKEKHGSYSVIPEMCANSEAELKEKVDTWLKGLIEIINEPLCQCPRCNGTGYIGEIKTEGFSYKENTK